MFLIRTNHTPESSHTYLTTTNHIPASISQSGMSFRSNTHYLIERSTYCMCYSQFSSSFSMTMKEHKLEVGYGTLSMDRQATIIN